MKLLRGILTLTILAYAGWLAWPLVSPFLDPLLGGASPDMAAMRGGAEVAIEGPGMPGAVLWIGAVVLYFVSALMLGAGNPKAAIAYFLGFLADAAVKLALDLNGGGAGDAARSAEMSTFGAKAAPAFGPDPVWLALGGLFLVGLLVVLAVRGRKARRQPGHLAA